MPADHRGGQHVKFIQPNDPVDAARTGNIGGRTDIIQDACVFFHRLCVIDRIPGPGHAEQILPGHECYEPAGLMSFLDELAALEFAGDDDYVMLHNTIGTPASCRQATDPKSCSRGKFNFSKKNVTIY